MSETPSIYYWNERRCIEQHNGEVVYLTSNNIFSYTEKKPIIRKNVQIFSLRNEGILYQDTEGHLLLYNLADESEEPFIYRPLKYGGYTDFIEDIEDNKILRRKHLELLDMQRELVKERYSPEGAYCEAFCNISEEVALLCEGRQISLIDYRAAETIERFTNCAKVSEMRHFRDVLVIGFYDGTIQILDADSNHLLLETCFTGFASSVPIGQITRAGNYLFVSAHWEKIKRISLDKLSEEEKSGLGSIYGIAALGEQEILVAGCSGVQLVAFDC